MRAATVKPGYSPLPTNEVARKEIVHTLAEEAKLNGQNFCVDCLVSGQKCSLGQ